MEIEKRTVCGCTYKRVLGNHSSNISNALTQNLFFSNHCSQNGEVRIIYVERLMDVGCYRENVDLSS